MLWDLQVTFEEQDWDGEKHQWKKRCLTIAHSYPGAKKKIEEFYGDLKIVDIEELGRGVIEIGGDDR